MPAPPAPAARLPACMAACMAVATLLTGACAAPAAPPGPLRTAPASEAVTDTVGEVGTERAFFATYPADLLHAAAEACSAPSQTLVRPDRDTVRCETLPTPEVAAALILTFDGTIEALPRFVIAFSAAPAQGGHVVTGQNYIHVPQRGGGVQEVRLRDPVINASMRNLLATAGGVPLR